MKQRILFTFLGILYFNLAFGQTQIKYLPMFREAVKNGKAAGGSLATMEDRVLLSQGEKQIYGSQLAGDYKTNI